MHPGRSAALPSVYSLRTMRGPMARVEGQKPMIAFASVGSWTKADALPKPAVRLSPARSCGERRIPGSNAYAGIPQSASC